MVPDPKRYMIRKCYVNHMCTTVFAGAQRPNSEAVTIDRHMHKREQIPA